MGRPENDRAGLEGELHGAPQLPSGKVHCGFPLVDYFDGVNQGSVNVFRCFSPPNRLPSVMPRQVRIQFAGAIYHCMARGDRREPIVKDETDRVLVEEGEHLGTLIDYVDLNPFRAGLVTLEDGLESYRWSSLPDSRRN